MCILCRSPSACLFLVLGFGWSLSSETLYSQEPSIDNAEGELNFGQDVEFLKKHVNTIVLQDESGQSQVAVVPQYQGRVMTSSAAGGDGVSFGWLNYEHIQSGKTVPHINVYGGEERFWLGPEGGQFAIFFKPGASFDLADWQTPAAIDTEAFQLISSDPSHAVFQHQASFQNYSGSKFKVQIDRTVRLLTREQAADSLGVKIDQLPFVGYRTENKITNVGDSHWRQDTGLLSIWLLGMFKPGPQTTVAIPYRSGPVSELGPVVNDSYFGKVPADRLKIEEDVVYFSGDGAYRSKIGISPRRSTEVCGSYDAERGVVTIVKFNLPESQTTEYVNSMWELQDDPYSGDVINSYNDGPPSPGAIALGPFYELETSSPALALSAGEAGQHDQETYHFMGDREQLDRLTTSILGVSLDQIGSALK